jgi:hypothetical protein
VSGTQPGSRRGLAIAAIVVIALASGWLLRISRHRAAADPLVAMPWQEALTAGERLMQQDRAADALPYYRHAIRGAGALDWRTHYALALAIRDPSVKDTLLLGWRGPRMRSTHERVRASSEALAELDQATRHAHTALERALIARLRGEIYANWGFVWDPLVIYQAAADDDPTGDCARHAGEFLARMADPVGATKK